MVDANDTDLRISAPGYSTFIPSGGEVWNIGSTQTITWGTYSGYCSSGNHYVNLEINRNYPSGTWTYINQYYDSSPSTSWTVTAPGGTNIRMRITYNGQPVAMSANNFTIFDPFKNVNIDYTSDALDIAIRPNYNTWDVYVLYTGGIVRVYPGPTYSASSYSTYSVDANSKFIDVNSAGYFVTAYNSGVNVYSRHYGPTGTLLASNTMTPSATYNSYVIGVTQDDYSGTYSGDHGIWYYYTNTATSYVYSHFNLYYDTAFTTSALISNSVPTTDPSNFRGDLMKAVDYFSYSTMGQYRSFYGLRSTYGGSSYKWVGSYYDGGGSSLFAMGWYGWGDVTAYPTTPYQRLVAPVDIASSYGNTVGQTCFVLDNDTASGGPGWCLKRAGMSLNLSSSYPPIALSGVTGTPLKMDGTDLVSSYNSYQRLVILSRDTTTDYMSIFTAPEL